MNPTVIALTTDFGTAGPYVAAMKGVILGINPDARLVDVSHEIAPQNIREAALCLSQVVPYFPPGTIHVVVVDPGVGSNRRLLCVRMHDQVFLAPDNGVLSWSARGAGTIERFELSESQFWRSQISSTFHGRDILAPAAAHLSLGITPGQLGRPVVDWERLPWPEPSSIPGGLEGELLAVDRFGNLITNIGESALSIAVASAGRVVCGATEIGSLGRTYSDVLEGELTALVGSSGLVEIAVRNGNAAARLGAGPGTRVRVLC
jgi:S-adenosylmethionine hydrolase